MVRARAGHSCIFSTALHASNSLLPTIRIESPSRLTADFGIHPTGEKTTANVIRTPFIDQMAAEGRKLSNYYVQPLCSPTRGTIMTGRYPSHTGIGPNVIKPTHPYALPGHEVTVADTLQAAGYRTHMVGKVTPQRHCCS